MKERQDGCQVCTAPTDMFLCPRCTGELRAMLTALVRGPYVTAVTGQTKSGGGWHIERRTPGLLEHLAEAAIGQVRLGGGGRRTRDAGLVAYTDPKPAADGLGGTEGQRRLEQDAENGTLVLAAVLRQGGVNPKASKLLADTNDLLAWFVNTLAAHGVRRTVFAAVPRHSVPGSIDMADWLAGSMATIPLLEDAGVFYIRLDRLRRRMEQVIDRPEPPRTCGPCPTIVGQQRQECATALEAQHNQTEVTCPSCKQSYDVEQLITRTYNALHYKTFTIRELVDTVLPRLDEHVPERTLYRWIKSGVLALRGENEKGDAVMLLSDVLSVRRSKPRHATA
jgi:hypothetical protein